MIGRLEPRKNYPLALAAFKIAKTLRPDLKLVITGDGPQRRDLHRTIERLGLRDVEIKSHATEEEKHQPLAQAEAFLHLGHPEGFSLALFEAATLGAPVITHPQVPAVTLLKTPQHTCSRAPSKIYRKSVAEAPTPGKTSEEAG
jgi:glycosyltransferase involved in cell wall biosynthesis